MAEQSVVQCVETKGVGFAPILRSYLERCGIAQIIDENVPLDPRRKTLTHGEASDTLDAEFKYGLGNIETLITQNMIREFRIITKTCHNDTTSASVYGNCDNNKTADSIRITFGHSKKHRRDLKQLVWSLSVSSDSGFPLFQKAYSGNTADVTTYVEQWQNLIDLLGRNDFLYVADSKLLTTPFA